MDLEQKLSQYNAKFGFRENPEDFNFALSPERVIYKNEALRQGDRNLYVQYLVDHFPNEMSHELADFDLKQGRLVKMNKEEVQSFMKEHGYNLLQADLSYSDQDSIFEARKVSEDNLNWELEGNSTDTLKAKATLADAFSAGKQWIYMLK